MTFDELVASANPQQPTNTLQPEHPTTILRTPSVPDFNVNPKSTADLKTESLFSTQRDKRAAIDIARYNKEMMLRKDEVDYGDDNWLVEAAKTAANEFLPHSMQLAVNKDGKRYNTENKIFNEDDLSNIWNKYEDDPAGNKTLYYLRKLDPVTGQYMYKPGIAHVSAADRYKTQALASGYEVIAEKRFDEASSVEKQIHGNKENLKHRVYDYGAVEDRGAEDVWGSGKSELYSKDILGLDTGTAEDYRKNKTESYKKMLGLLKNERQAENTFEFIDAFQAGAITLGAQGLKLIGEAVGQQDTDNAVEALGKSLEKRANQIAGYNPVGAKEASEGLQRAYDNNDPIRYIYHMAKGAPQWLAQSLPNMGAFAATAVGTTAVTGNPMAGMMAGSALMGALRANDILDTREEQNNGRKATGEEATAVFAASSVLSLLEYGVLKFAFTGKGLMAKDAAGKTIDLNAKVLANNPKTRGELASMIGKHTAESTLAEGSEEVVSGLGEFLMTNYGTDKYQGKTIAELLQSDEAEDIAVTSFGAGAGAGGLASIGGGISKVTDEINKNKISKNMEATVKEKGSQQQKDIVAQAEADGRDMNSFTPEEKDAYVRASIDKKNAEEVAKLEPEFIQQRLEDTKEATLATVKTKLEAANLDEYTVSSYIDALDKRLDEEGYFKTEDTATPVDEAIQTTEPIVDTVQDTTIDETPVSEDKAVNEKVKRAGLVNVLTPQDKAAGLSVELTTMDEGERLTNIGKTKTKALDVYDVDDKVFSMILNDDFTVDTMEGLIQGKNITNMKERLTGHLESTAKVQQEIKGIADTLSKTIATDKGKKILQSIFSGEEITLEKALRATALALNGVRSGITSEADINIQNGLEIPTHKGARRLGLNVQLGKELYNSYGIKVAGEASVINRKYAEVGDKIIALAEEAGLVKVKKDQEIVAHKLHTEAGKSLYTEKELHKAGIRQAKDRKDASGKTTPMMVDDIITLVDNKSDKGNRLVESATGYAMSMLTKLLKPINYEPPTTAPVKEVKVATGMTISKKHTGYVVELNGLSYTIKPEYISLLQEVKEIINGYASTDEAMRQDPLIAGLIGVENTNTALNKLNEDGQSSNRKRDLLQIIENLDMFDGGQKFYFNYDMDTTQRIHVVQNILNFQGGKYMNRPMITGGEHTTNTQKEYDFLVESIAQEAKLPVDAKAVEAYMNEHKVTKKEATKKIREAEVKNPTNEYVVAAMKMFEEDGKIEVHQLLELAKNLKAKNPVALLGDLRAIYDISTAKGYKVTTTSQAQADASGSGLMNTMLNLSGFMEKGVPVVQKLLARLGIGKEGIELSNLDPYLILLDGVKKHWKGPTYDITIKPIEDRLVKLGIDIRDIAKYAVIPWLYGQHYKKTEIEMANSIAVDVVNVAIKESNQDAIDEVNGILGSKKYYLSEDVDNIELSVEPKHEHFFTKANRLLEVVKAGNYVVFDTETTDSVENKGDIIQAAYITYENGIEVDRDTIWIPSDKTSSTEAFAAHHITPEMLADNTKGVTREEQLAKLQKKLAGRQILAHNVKFDLDIFNANATEIGLPTLDANNVHDTMGLASAAKYATTKNSKYVNAGTSLKTLSSDYGYDYTGAHDAMFDIELTAKLIPHLEKTLRETEARIDNGGVGSSITDITTKDVAKLTDHYKKNLTKYYIAAIDSTFPGIKQYRKKVEQLYDVLNDNGWKGKLRSAMSALDNESDEDSIKHKIDVRKNKQTFTKSIDGVSVVAYNKMFNNKTSLQVIPQLNSDSALLLKSIDNVIAELKEAGKEVPGIQTIHDNVITTPEVALMIKREYDRLTVELAGKYDFLHAVELEVLDIIKEKEAAGDTKGAKNLHDKLYDKKHGILRDEEGIREAKAAYLDGLEVSILGSKDIKLDPKETVKKEPKAKTEEKAEPKADKEVNKVDKVYGELLTTFTLAMNTVNGKPISAENKAKIIKGLEALGAVVSKTHIATLNKVIGALKGNIDTNGIGIERTAKFEGTTGVIGIELAGLRKDPRTNYTAIMNPDRLVEILGHEIEHALEYEYISTHMDSKEVRYLKKVLDKIISPEFMNKLSPATRHRINTSINIKDVDDARRITELSSVLNNEVEYANEILSVLATNKSQIMKVLHNVIEAIKNWLSKMTPETISKLIDEGLTKDGKIGSIGTVAALQQLSNQAEVYLAEHPDSTFSMKGNIKSKRDIYSNVYLSPYEAANSIIARSNSYMSKYIMVYGGLVVDVFGPSVKAAHEKGMSESDLYKQMILLIRTGMMSETAQQMAQFLKVTGDSKKELLDNMQGVATEISQKSMALHEEMAVLDRLVKKTYPDKKDQVRVYQIFSKTGISNLTTDKEIMKSVMDGKLDIKEALKKIGSQVENKEVLNEVADVYLGVSTRPDRINTGMAEDHTDMAKMYVALKVLSKIDGAEDMLNKMGKPLKQQLMHLAVMNQTMSEQVNERGTMYEGDTYAQASRYYNDYDGHYSMDIHDGQYEFNMVTEGDMRSSRYSESEDWILLKEPKGENVGLVARKLLTPMNTPGMGLNYNRFNNGFYMDEDQSQKLMNKLDKMENPKVYLNENGIVQDGTRFRFLLDEKTKVEKLGMMQNVAEGMYRTMIHNKELIESQTVRNMIIDAGIQKVETEEELWELNDFLVENKKKAIHKREETSPFIYINPKTYKGYDSLPPQIKLLYKTPENMTTYEGFNERITLVKKAEAHEILGHKNVQFFSDSRGMAKAEMVFKNLVVLSKLHMVVTAPLKLATDIASNIGILSTMDIPFTEMGRGGKKGWEGYSRISRLRSELGVLQMEARMANAGIKIDGVTDSYDSLLKKVESKKKQIEKDDFYDAFKAGFIQSYSTSLIMKEFDVISGLQKDIDTVVDSITLDKEGNPNDVHKAIKKWMSFGLEIDSLLTSASKLSKVNGTSVGKEMAEIADRLRSKKDAQSVARYVSELIGAPSSEIVTYGGAAMVISDALSKYTLAKHLLGELGGNRIVNPKTNKPYTKVEAYAKANETFIDFRYNMPPAVKALSDYGILMFPSFWMRTQKVIASLILYHPATAIGGYMIEDYLNMGSANIIDANFGEMLNEGSVLHDPVSILSPNSVAWWL